MAKPGKPVSDFHETFSHEGLRRRSDLKRTNSKQVFLRASVGVVCLLFLATGSRAQAPASESRQGAPSKPIRPFVVLHAQSLSDVEKKLHPDDKTVELI